VFNLKTKGEQVPFLGLQDGSEILVEMDDLPEPPDTIFQDNPYERHDPLYIRWRAAAKARYVKACYKAAVEAKNREDFLSKVGDARSVLNDPTAWENYLSCRGLDHPKRKPGRPRLPDHLKKRNPRIKRSEQMKALLFEKGIEVSPEGKLLLNGNADPYEGWLLPNGRVKFLGDQEFGIEPYNLSAHQFLKDYV